MKTQEQIEFELERVKRALLETKKKRLLLEGEDGAESDLKRKEKELYESMLTLAWVLSD